MKRVVAHIGDPFVLTASDGKYYMYCTNHVEIGGYNVWSSSDLENWTLDGQCFKKSDTNWCYKDFWAPEVIEYNNRFYMFYTAREKSTDLLKIGVAVSDKPTGPFIDEKNKPLLDIDYAIIDASVLVDEDKIYMYYSRDCSTNIIDGIHRSDIYAIELDDNFDPISEPLFLFHPTQEWETNPLEKDFLWNEGPSVIKVGDFYYMTYSANPFWSVKYSVGVATSHSPLGPFNKDTNNPVLASELEKGISGPGHNSIFKSHDGTKIYIAYHVHHDPNVGGGDRDAIISEVIFKDGTMNLI